MFRDISRRQRLYFVLVLLVSIAIVILGLLLQSPADQVPQSEFTVAMAIKEIAPALEITGKSLARELGLPLDAPKAKPLASLGITQEQLDHAAAHILGHSETTLKYYVFAALVLFGLVYLVRLGRPDGSAIQSRKTWYPRWPYVACLVLAVGVCGFALGKSPNPMESAVKVFKSMVGLYPSVADKVLSLCFFGALAIIGSKLICGWACPFGALQEIIYHLPFFKRLKKRKLPFGVTNSIRVVLFVVMLLILFGVLGEREGFVLYHYTNPFNLFNFDIETVTVGATIMLALILSFGFYRPFCQFICPFGLLSWVLERVSLFRVRIDRNRCIQCGACAHACPIHAARDRVAGKRLPADCFSCARCLNTCPVDAIHYEFVFKKRSDKKDET